MALTSLTMGKTLTTTSGNVQIFGVPFNPYVVDSTITGITNTVSDGGTFDLSGFQYGHEVILSVATFSDTGQHFITYRKGSTVLYERYFSSSSNILMGYIGIDYDEIMSNGSDYYVDAGYFSSSSDEGSYNYNGDNVVSYTYSPVFLSGLSVGDSLVIRFYDWDLVNDPVFMSTGQYTVSSIAATLAYFGTSVFPTVPNGHSRLCLSYKGRTVEATRNFQISNFPSLYEGTPGHVWVEGENLCYVGAERGTSGYKHVIKHDGSSYGSSSNYGSFWIDTTDVNKLGYVSQSGVVRKTHAADYYWSQQGNESSISGATPGHVWVSGQDGNHGYLTFIGNDGHGYRIMNGSV